MANFKTHSSSSRKLTIHSQNALVSFSQAWASRYVKNVHQPAPTPTLPRSGDDPKVKNAVIQTLQHNLRSVSAQAWNKTEALLAEEVVRHQMSPEHIDPWAIARDVFRIFDQAFKSYAQSKTPERFAVNISPQLGEIRKTYTAHDPRVIGFVSMQFHYTGRLLLQCVDPQFHAAIQPYFKAIDDHLYMPLHRAYDAAGSYPKGSMELAIVQRLLPRSSTIAKRVVAGALKSFPGHKCYTGALHAPLVQESSLRDTEMFQIYIWVCLLEQNISIIQQELFPLCVMLYLVFNVKWDMVRYLLTGLEHEFMMLLSPEEFKVCAAYLDSLKVIFSNEVFEATQARGNTAGYNPARYIR